MSVPVRVAGLEAKLVSLRRRLRDSVAECSRNDARGYIPRATRVACSDTPSAFGVRHRRTPPLAQPPGEGSPPGRTSITPRVPSTYPGFAVRSAPPVPRIGRAGGRRGRYTTTTPWVNFQTGESGSLSSPAVRSLATQHLQLDLVPFDARNGR